MKKPDHKRLLSCAAAIAAALAAGNAHATSIANLYNTGVDASGNMISDGQGDTYWNVGKSTDSGSTYSTLSHSYAASASGSGVAVESSNGTLSTYWVNSTNTAGQSSYWISTTANHLDTDSASGTYYDYRVHFDMSLYDLTKAVSIGGSWASDNKLLKIGINGNFQSTDTITGAGNSYGTVGSQRTTMHNFTLNALTQYLVQGQNNYIDFIIQNTVVNSTYDSNNNNTNATGLDVRFTSSATLAPVQNAPVDAPETLGLLGLGLAGWRLLPRRRRMA